MELFSIIPGFQPKNDPVLLAKADALKPDLIYTDYPAPAVCRVNGEEMSVEQLASRPLRRGDMALLDFGRHVVGRLSLRLSSAGSHQDAPAYVQIDLAERLEELEEDPEAYRGWLSRSWIQQEKLHVDALPETVNLPRRYAFRYARITVLDTSPKYQLLLQSASCRAESAADWKNVSNKNIPDEEFKRIYEVSLATLADCAQEVLEDGPKRDRRLWLGDLRLQALTDYVSFRNTDLVKRCLYLFAGTRFPDGRMSANVFTASQPEADDTYFMDYALLFPVALKDYMTETGDREALDDLFSPALEQVEFVLSNDTDADGVLLPEAGRQGFIDWSETLDRTAALQGVLIQSIDACGALCGMKRETEKAARYERLADDLRRAAKARFWDEQKHCFLSNGQVSIHSQVWLALAGAMPEGKTQAAFEKALSLPGAPQMETPYMHHYYVMALLEAGLKDEAAAHLKAYWGGMIRAGADTFWECFDPRNPKSSPYGGMIVNSFCHAWSCTPAYLIEKYFL